MDSYPREPSGLAQWFVNDVMPLEPMLVRFLSRNWRNHDEVRDLLQEVYVRVYEAAARDMPRTSRNARATLRLAVMWGNRLKC